MFLMSEVPLYEVLHGSEEPSMTISSARQPDVAHTRQSRPGSGRDFKVKVLKRL